MIAVLFWPSEKETAHKTSQTNDSKAFRCLYKAFWSTLEVPDRKLVALAFCSYPIRSRAVFDVFTYAHVRKPFGIC